MIQDIEKQIDERKNTLSEIERALFTQRYKLSQKHLEIFSAHSIAMIYSIWEGYISFALKAYITYINTLELSFEDLADEIKILQLETQFKQFTEYPNDYLKKIKFHEDLRKFHTQEKIAISPLVVNTESNVDFDTLNKMLKKLCLKHFPEHWGKYTYPTSNLKETLKDFLMYRNSIVHGMDIIPPKKVNHEVYNRYKKLVEDLMYGVQEKILEGKEQQTYLKK